MEIVDLQKVLTSSAFTSDMLQAILSAEYSNVNKTISKMAKKGELLRLKRGVYAYGEKYRVHPINKIAVANLLLKPSYVSFEYALSYHGLIPERVYEITSATWSKNETFETEIGRYSYRKIPRKAFSIGLNWSHDNQDGGYLIATPEKALCDKVKKDKEATNMSQTQLAEYLENDLRIEWHDLVVLDSDLIRQIAIAYSSETLRDLGALIAKRSKLG